MRDKSRLFRAYNAARALGLDRKRLNKGLGLAQRKAPLDYGANADYCGCPDQKYRPGEICKHRIAAALSAA